ncbi:unnamed protein product [Prorocentrum cordatum]|uniref:Uncharacterized protein n=1 Tax=Prorocentrum cordatum TaxID=2364126 RepID=A0ABN9XNL2_9DINO|nr:unnamed protein product [Polarella glacialis]
MPIFQNEATATASPGSSRYLELGPTKAAVLQAAGRLPAPILAGHLHSGMFPEIRRCRTIATSISGTGEHDAVLVGPPRGATESSVEVIARDPGCPPRVPVADYTLSDA